MEKGLVLKVERREKTGSKSAARLRAGGLLPAIVYGRKQQPVAISLDTHAFLEVLHHGRRLLDVKMDRRAEKMIVKDIQYDHLDKDIIHADLMRVDVGDTVSINVPVELKGIAKGTHEGGIIEEHADHLEIECKVTDIPEVIIVSVKDLNVGDTLHAGDIELPAGVKLLSEPTMLLVACHLVAAAKSTEEVEQQVPAAPEVIGEAERQAEPEQEK